jgi:hypothetical protein
MHDQSLVVEDLVRLAHSEVSSVYRVPD